MTPVMRVAPTHQQDVGGMSIQPNVARQCDIRLVFDSVGL
jgi:hypothetical protein